MSIELFTCITIFTLTSSVFFGESFPLSIPIFVTDFHHIDEVII